MCTSFLTGPQAVDNPLVRKIMEALQKDKLPEGEEGQDKGQDKKGPTQTFSDRHSSKGKKSSSVS